MDKCASCELKQFWQRLIINVLILLAKVCNRLTVVPRVILSEVRDRPGNRLSRVNLLISSYISQCVA
jgi:hypothetical protein